MSPRAPHDTLVRPATGWMTGASSQAGTQSANRRPTSRPSGHPPNRPPHCSDGRASGAGWSFHPNSAAGVAFVHFCLAWAAAVLGVPGVATGPPVHVWATGRGRRPATVAWPRGATLCLSGRSRAISLPARVAPGLPGGSSGVMLAVRTLLLARCTTLLNCAETAPSRATRKRPW